MQGFLFGAGPQTNFVFIILVTLGEDRPGNSGNFADDKRQNGYYQDFFFAVILFFFQHVFKYKWLQMNTSSRHSNVHVPTEILLTILCSWSEYGLNTCIFVRKVEGIVESSHQLPW